MEIGSRNMKDAENGYRSCSFVKNDQAAVMQDQEALFYPMITEFKSFCSRISVAKNVQQRACHFLQDLLTEELLETPSKVENVFVFAAIIYMALVETRLPYGPSDPHLAQGSLEPPSLTVTDLLNLADININKLFKTLDVIKAQYVMSRTVQNHLMLMERNYCVVCALFHTFESRLCPAIFRDENKSDNPDFLPPMPETEGVAFRKKQCWLLFLLSKNNLLPDQHTLCQHFQLLLCCLEFVLRQAPSFLLTAPYDSIRVGCCTKEQKTTMIERLAKDFDVSVEETLLLHKRNTEPYFQKLLNKDGELDSDWLRSQYMKIYSKEGDINELLFLEKDSHLVPTQAQRVTNHSSTQSQLLPEQMTPVRVVVSTVQYLLQNFAHLSEEPSDKLQAHFQKCSQNPSEGITKTLGTLKERFLEEYQTLCAAPLQAAVVEHRFSLGVKIYYRVLETMLDAESDRQPQQVLTTLLNTQSFHKALLACAVEVVLTTYGQCWNQAAGELSAEATPFSFPWILNVFSLQAYDFYKVIENFISAEPKLPKDVVKHLHSVEFGILDSLAWKEDSSLFDTLEYWDKGQATPPMSVSPAKQPEIDSPHSSSDHTRSAVDLFLSPARPHSSAGISASFSSLPSSSSSSSLPTSPVRQPSPNADSVINDTSVWKPSTLPKSRSLSHFLCRVCRLGYCRLAKLCNFLGVARELQQKIWTCFENCVTKRPTLIRNRHIDQIIMCCIYGICKVTEQEIRFKDIVNEYRKLPHARQEVYKDVFMTADKRDSIINFYNQIFMHNLKNYILQFSPNRPVRPQLSPMPKQPAASPSYALPGKRNFTISPMKESPFKTPQSPSQMTPSTKLLYSFGDSVNSSEKLREINERNERFSARKTGPASAKKRLNLDMPGPGTSSKARKVL